MTDFAPPSDEPICQRASPQTMAGLLGGVHLFRVPAFQRDYSWDRQAVELFLQDMERCRYARVSGDPPRPHFFGAIVTCPALAPGTPRPHELLIDGQQRLATICLYISRLRRRFRSAATRAGDQVEFKEAFETRVREIQTYFEVVFDLDIRTPVDRRKLSLNRVDNPFFTRLLDGQTPAPSRSSHYRLAEAAVAIDAYFDDLFVRSASSEDDERILTSLYTSFLRDLEVVHISARTRTQAISIYRVLNSRGVPVSDCDLLRAGTLERIDGPLSADELNGTIDAWDQILGLNKDDPDEFLDLAYQSRTGVRRPSDRAGENFETAHFRNLAVQGRLTSSEAVEVATEVAMLRDDCVQASHMKMGELPHPDANNFSAVTRDRFRALNKTLSQSYCLPILMAANSLTRQNYADLIEVLDRFAYRYGVIVRAPIGPFERLIESHIQTLRGSPQNFILTDLATGLNDLLDEYASMDVFLQRISSLRHGMGQNAQIRYLLAMIEWTNAWFTGGAQGKPRVIDGTRGIDIENITIEHISARRPQDVDPDLQPVIDTLGNLTLLSEEENNGLGNTAFENKIPIFERSNFAINRALVANGRQTWSAGDVAARDHDLRARCEAIFTLQNG